MQVCTSRLRIADVTCGELGFGPGEAGTVAGDVPAASALAGDVPAAAGPGDVDAAAAAPDENGLAEFAPGLGRTVVLDAEPGAELLLLLL